jgi:hypothetical protein
MHVGNLPSVLKSVKDTLVLELIENHELRAGYAKHPKVSFSLTKGPGGFGIKWSGAKTASDASKIAPGLLIGGLDVEVDHPNAGVNTPECWMHVGFQVVEINKVNVAMATAAELPSILEMGGNTLSVVVEENPHLRAMYMPQFGTTAVEQIVVPNSSHGFGVQFGGAKDVQEAEASGPGIFVAEVELDFPVSDFAPRLVGKQVLMVNGHEMTDGNLMDMLAIVSDLSTGDNDLILRVVTNKQLVGHSGGDGVTTSIVLKRDGAHSKTPYGLKIGGPKNQFEGEKYGFGIIFDGAKDGSLAATYGPGMVFGWQVLSMNGADCTHSNTAEFKGAMKGVGNEMRLELRENKALRAIYLKKREKAAATKMAKIAAGGDQAKKPARPIPANAVTVLLFRGNHGFGLQFGGAKDEAEAESNGFGIYIAQTKPGGAASNEQAIELGMQVLQINKVDVFDFTTEDLTVLLKGVDDTMELVLTKNTTLSTTYRIRLW